jgi:tripartite-type tricarboxylate transporter receptor subunit TctC
MRRIHRVALAAATAAGLLVGAAAAISVAPAAAAAADAPALTILEPYGPGSVTDRLIGLLQPGLAKASGQVIKVDHAAGADAALQQLAAAPADGNTVIVVALLPSEIAAAAGQPGIKLSQLTAIAKLTGPGSVALIVPNASPIRNWAQFAAAARAHPLRVASPGRSSAAAVPLALMERALNVHFTDVEASTRADILDALDAGRADAGFLVSATLLPGPLPFMSAPPVRPIVTFGAQRSPALKEVPTFAASIGPQPHARRHNAITSALALFGPPGMKPAAVKRLVAEFAAAETAAKQGGSFVARVIPLSVGNAALLRETMARDQRVIKEVVGYLH